jgi:hypothetical protein
VLRNTQQVAFLDVLPKYARSLVETRLLRVWKREKNWVLRAILARLPMLRIGAPAVDPNPPALHKSLNRLVQIDL